MHIERYKNEKLEPMRPFKLAELKALTELPKVNSANWLVNAEGSVDYLSLIRIIAEPLTLSPFLFSQAFLITPTKSSTNNKRIFGGKIIL